jgi:hypothetical protein
MKKHRHYSNFHGTALGKSIGDLGAFGKLQWWLFLMFSSARPPEVGELNHPGVGRRGPMYARLWRSTRNAQLSSARTCLRWRTLVCFLLGIIFWGVGSEILSFLFIIYKYGSSPSDWWTTVQYELLDHRTV